MHIDHLQDYTCYLQIFTQNHKASISKGLTQGNLTLTTQWYPQDVCKFTTLIFLETRKVKENKHLCIFYQILLTWLGSFVHVKLRLRCLGFNSNDSNLIIMNFKFSYIGWDIFQTSRINFHLCGKWLLFDMNNLSNS